MDIAIFVGIGQNRGHLWILELEKLGEIHGYWNYHRNLGKLWMLICYGHGPSFQLYES